MLKCPFRFLALFSLASCLMAANLLINPGFETGDFTGWTPSGWFIDTSAPNSGTYDTATGCGGTSCTTPGDPDSAYFYQDILTIPGTIYALSFFYNSGDLATQGTELLVQWGDPNAPNLSTVVDLINTDTSGTYVQFTGSVTATSATSQLEFLGRQDFSEYFVDDLSLTGSPGSGSNVPEPGPLYLLLSTLPVVIVKRLLPTRGNTAA